ncbi:MAG TPA: glucose-6-phosphate isomerase [Candidatus Omnitrophota bacterium]|nr:glucose-6-phosphate isomerase [Candidatus Omnitrophota bacterium]HPD84682.1 glucose-6-phosphate isomerase [Candidatus Omnitrophota bacterium]HRZ03540.1 glucose-6-phosphate isomerase [Candidatus Omnitrophota bacterium]
MNITFNRDNLKGFVDEAEFKALILEIQKAHEAIEKRNGPGAEFTGWVDLPGRIKDSFLADVTKLGREVRKNSDCLVSIGIGGSYLGIRATIEFLGTDRKFPVYYAGQNLSSDGLHDLLDDLKSKKVTVVVISKSGTTTEPAVAFRIIKKFMHKKYSAKELKKRIICVTDEKKGALRKIAEKEGYQTFIIPDDVGGRFSVLTPVGLVPLSIAGVDVKALIAGARLAQSEFSKMDLEKNIAYQYAAARYLLYKKGKAIEVLSSFYPNMFYVAEWWKQLFGESEGKNGQGIFPASLNLTADLHSMGQLMQDGVRNVFETFLIVDKPKYKLTIPSDKDNLDNFNCVAAKDLDFVNKQAYRATAMAHYEGGVSNMTITVSDISATTLGQLYYFFEKAVAISGYLLGVNPFDQPGVEAYKKKMFELLGRK